MVVVGGVTRLTHSGLSITEWQPIVGTLPPLDATRLERSIRQVPGDAGVPRRQPRDDARRSSSGIFWWEYVHRLLGRAIGIVFLVPYLWFLARRRIPRGLRVAARGHLRARRAAGRVGWYMVQSGLVDDPRVSQFRLTAHLGLAFVIFGAMLWTALSLAFPRASIARPHAVARRLRRFADAIAALVFVMVLSGGFVAGIRAGFAYNTFPLMNGPHRSARDPDARAVVEEFLLEHGDRAVRSPADRLAARVRRAAAMVATAARRTSRARATARGTALLAMLAVQIALGIATLVNVVPLPLAALHQAGAVAVFALALDARPCAAMKRIRPGRCLSGGERR